MTLLKLMQLANAGFPDAFLENYYDRVTGQALPRTLQGEGDTLAEFVVRELAETYDADASEVEQIAEAVRVLTRAQGDLEDTINSIYTAAE